MRLSIDLSPELESKLTDLATRLDVAPEALAEAALRDFVSHGATDPESLRRQRERISLLQGIERGEAALNDGRIVTPDEAKARLVRWFT